MTIRNARATDLEALLGVQRAAAVAAFPHVYPQDRYPFPDQAIREVLRNHLANLDVFVAEENGSIVGFACVAPGWLVELYVHPDAQSRGVGSRLHDEAVARRRSAGDRELRLWTLEENHVGRPFYESRGWTLAPETRVVDYPPYPLDVSYVLPL